MSSHSNFWRSGASGRGDRTRAEREQRAGRVRRTGALVVVGALAVGWFVTARVGDSDALAQSGGPSPRPVPTTLPAVADPLRMLVPTDAQCRDQEGSASPLRCAVAGVDVEYRRVRPSEVGAAYRAGIGEAPGGQRARQGPPACARGGEDERAWSRPDAPARAAGRYACRVERGRAAMWWTVDDRGLLAHATASNADLGSLFAWWTAHSER